MPWQAKPDRLENRTTSSSPGDLSSFMVPRDAHTCAYSSSVCKSRAFGANKARPQAPSAGICGIPGGPGRGGTWLAAPSTLAGGKETFKALNGHGKSAVRGRAPQQRREALQSRSRSKRGRTHPQQSSPWGRALQASRQQADFSTVGERSEGQVLVSGLTVCH